METPRSILRVLQQGQWLTSFHLGTSPTDRQYFCQYGTSWQLTILQLGLLTSRRVFKTNAHTNTDMCPPPLGSIHMYWDDSLTNPGAHQEALELTSWLDPLCQKHRLVTNLEISVNLISGYHICNGYRTWIRTNTSGTVNIIY